MKAALGVRFFARLAADVVLEAADREAVERDFDAAVVRDFDAAVLRDFDAAVVRDLLAAVVLLRLADARVVVFPVVLRVVERLAAADRDEELFDAAVREDFFADEADFAPAVVLDLEVARFVAVRLPDPELFLAVAFRGMDVTPIVSLGRTSLVRAPVAHHRDEDTPLIL
jgi:hypothetical protein